MKRMLSEGEGEEGVSRFVRSVDIEVDIAVDIVLDRELNFLLFLSS